MRWVRQGLWIAAWGGWVWCGFGLARELPRHDGAVLKRLSMVPNEHPLGFFSGGRLLATFLPIQENKRDAVRVWDVARGEVLREVVLADIGWVYQFSARHGVLVGTAPPAQGAAGRIGALKLETGLWTKLPGKLDRPVHFHPIQPWVLCTEWDDVNRGYQIQVVDLTTGNCIFTWHPDPRDPARKITNPMMFLPDSGALLVQTQVMGLGQPPDLPAVQIWKLSESSATPERVFHGLKLGYRSFGSMVGRVGWTDYFTEPYSARVLDLNDGTVSTFPPDATSPEYFVCSVGRRMPEAMMSPDGRGIFLDDVIWDLSRRIPLWKCTAFEKPSKLAELGIPCIEEDWSKLLGDWAHPFKTMALRDIATGHVVYRTWLGSDPQVPSEDLIDRTHGVYIDEDALRQYPPPPNYPLLALCQTILALPLVLTWLALRWRRKRRLRLAGAAS